MKIKATNFVLPIYGFYLITSVYAVSVIPVVHGFVRIFRFITLPILFFTVLVLLPRQLSSKLSKLIFLLIPPLILLLVNFLQLFALSGVALSTHITGSTKFFAWFLLYFAAILCLNTTSVGKIKRVLLIVMVSIFVIGILQYPKIILDAGAGLSTALTNYGQNNERYQLAGIFGSANEDANGFVTLLPLTLWSIEKQTGWKKKILRCSLLLYFPLIMVFNGTRTALLISMPVVLMIFYSKLSLKNIPYILGPFSALGLLITQLSNTFLGRFFSQESEGGGSFGWRVEQVWIPSIQHTLSNSPLFGFGSRGWEFLTVDIGLLKSDGVRLISSHSGYVWTLVAWGGIGFLAYVSFLLILLIEAFQLSKSNNTDTAMAGRALFASMIGYCLWAFISNVMQAQGWLTLISLATLIASFKFSNSFDIQGGIALGREN